MAKTTDSLFKYDPLESYLDKQYRLLDTAAGRLTLEDVIESEAAGSTRDVTPLVLVKEDAKFVTKTLGGGFQVTMTLPLVGSTRLLSHPTGPRIQMIQATVTDVGWGHDTSSLAITLGFTTETPDEVKAAFRVVIGQIQSVLDAGAPLVEKHNDRAAVRWRELLVERRKTIQASGDAADGLTDGI